MLIHYQLFQKKRSSGNRGYSKIPTKTSTLFSFIERKSAACFPLQTNEKEILIAFQVFTLEIFRFFYLLFFGGRGVSFNHRWFL